MAARSERVTVKGVPKEMSRHNIEMYAVCLHVQAKRQLADRRRAAERANERRREIARRREARDER